MDGNLSVADVAVFGMTDGLAPVRERRVPGSDVYDNASSKFRVEIVGSHDTFETVGSEDFFEKPDRAVLHEHAVDELQAVNGHWEHADTSHWHRVDPVEQDGHSSSTKVAVLQNGFMDKEALHCGPNQSLQPDANGTFTAATLKIDEPSSLFLATDPDADVCEVSMEAIIHTEFYREVEDPLMRRHALSIVSLDSNVDINSSAPDAGGDVGPAQRGDERTVSASDYCELFAGMDKRAEESACGSSSPHSEEVIPVDIVELYSGDVLSYELRNPPQLLGIGSYVQDGKVGAFSSDVIEETDNELAFERASLVVQDLNSESSFAGGFEFGSDLVGDPAEVRSGDVCAGLAELHVIDAADPSSRRHALSVVSLDSDLDPSSDSYCEAAWYGEGCKLLTGDFCELHALVEQTGDERFRVGASTDDNLIAETGSAASSSVERSLHGELDARQMLDRDSIVDMATDKRVSFQAEQHLEKTFNLRDPSSERSGNCGLQASYDLVRETADIVAGDSATYTADIVLQDSIEEVAYAGPDGELRDAIIRRHTSSFVSLDSNPDDDSACTLARDARSESAHQEFFSDYCELFPATQSIGGAVVDPSPSALHDVIAVADNIALDLTPPSPIEGVSLPGDNPVDIVYPGQLCDTGLPVTVEGDNLEGTLGGRLELVTESPLYVEQKALVHLEGADTNLDTQQGEGSAVSAVDISQLQSENFAMIDTSENSVESALVGLRSEELSGSSKAGTPASGSPRSRSPRLRRTNAFRVHGSDTDDRRTLSGEFPPSGQRSPRLRRRSHEPPANVESTSELRVRSRSLLDMPTTTSEAGAATTSADENKLIRNMNAFLSGSIVNIDLSYFDEPGLRVPSSSVLAMDTSDESVSDMDELSVSSSYQESSTTVLQPMSSLKPVVADDDMTAYDIIDRFEIKQVESEKKHSLESSALFSVTGIRDSIRRTFSLRGADEKKMELQKTRSEECSEGVDGVRFRFSTETTPAGEAMQVVNVHRNQLETDVLHESTSLSVKSDIHQRISHPAKFAAGISRVKSEKKLSLPSVPSPNVANLDRIDNAVPPPVAMADPHSKQRSATPDVVKVADVPTSFVKSASSARIAGVLDSSEAPAASYKQKSEAAFPRACDLGDPRVADAVDDLDELAPKRNAVELPPGSPMASEAVATSGDLKPDKMVASKSLTDLEQDDVTLPDDLQEAKEVNEDGDGFERLEMPHLKLKHLFVDKKIEGRSERSDYRQVVADGKDPSDVGGSKDAGGQNAADTNPAGLLPAGLNQAVSDPAGPSKAGNSQPGQDHAGQDHAGPDQVAPPLRQRKASVKMSQTFSTADRVVKPSPASLVSPRRITDPNVQSWAESMFLSQISSPIFQIGRAGKDDVGPSDKLHLITDSYPALLPSFPTDRRSCIALELYTTERSYVRGLEIVVKLFKRKLASANMLDSKEMGMIFANVEEIMAFNTELLGGLFDRISAWSDEEKIGDIFLQHENRFKMYAEYCRGYDAGEALLKQKLKKKKDLENLLNACYKYPACSPGLTIISYLITVIQRIPRYILLLKDLAKRTDLDHPDLPNLVAACAMMEKVAQYLNQQLSESQGKRALEALQTQIIGLKAYYIPERTLVRQGSVCLMTSKKTYQCVLFNDLLVFAVKAANKPSEVELALELTTVWFEDLVDLDPQTIKQDAIEISTPDRPFTMYVGNANEKKLWLQHLKNAIEKHLSRMREKSVSDRRKEALISYIMPTIREVRKATYTYSSGAMYSGDFLDGRRHGQGTMIWPNQVSYQGAWEDDEMNGYGILQYLSGDVYEGNWRDNQQGGVGTLRYANGDIYCGEWKNGLRHGKAVVTFKNGDVFDGLFAHDRIDGRGELTCKSGLFYSGQWKKNMKHGKGELKTTDGCHYKGTFFRDQFHHKGELTYSNGAIYKGDFERGERCGYGSYTVPGGCSYEGQWMHDLMDGRGRITFENGDSYDGTWVHNERTGQGTMVYNYGGYYRGQWFSDQCHGSGVREFKDGSTYDGMWEHGKMHGQGKMKYSDGRIYTGSWREGLYHGQGILKKATGWYYDGIWAQGQRHGRGTCCDTLNGYRFEGQWVNGLKEGRGEEKINNVEFVGEFANDQRSGFGRESFPDGSTYEGTWLHGQKHGTGTVTTLKRVMEKQMWVHGTLVNSPQMFSVREMPIISRW